MDVIDIARDVQIEWYHDKRIVAFVLRSTNRSTIDRWANSAIEVVSAWKQEQPYLAMYDVSGATMLTPYGRERAKDIARAAWHTNGAYAVILPSTPLGKLIRKFIEHDLQRANPKYERQVFTDKGRSLKWLETFL